MFKSNLNTALRQQIPTRDTGQCHNLGAYTRMQLEHPHVAKGKMFILK